MQVIPLLVIFGGLWAISVSDITPDRISKLNNKEIKMFDVDTFSQEKNVSEQKRAERLNRNFARMLQLVNILGQVDTFVSERLKTMLRKLALLADDDVYYRRRM
ncbi:hypothetical protein FQA39_LY16982 [Lamprigera yunnana]|nr:hypothetical protein FQA39_LY16982 [Lamprigera yunnana]